MLQLADNEFLVGEVKAQLAAVQKARNEAEKFKKDLSANQVCSQPSDVLHC